MKALHKLTEEEIIELKKSIKEGIAEEIINKHLRIANKKCPVCLSEVEEGKLTLHFEEGNFRKKASFCGNDCLKYFLELERQHEMYDAVKEIDLILGMINDFQKSHNEGLELQSVDKNELMARLARKLR